MTTPPPTTDLSADEARRIALRAQGFLGTPDRRGESAASSVPSGRSNSTPSRYSPAPTS